VFELLNPAYLFGLMAAAIPLIIHLSRSRRTKKMRFSTTRFFTDQFLRSYRMSQLKELLLLACRMLLFGLFALALAQPLLRPRNLSAASLEGDRTVVLVLDNSASMGYIEDGKTLLERAREAARGVVGNLREGDRVAIVLAGRRESGPELLIPEPTGNRGEALQAIDRLQVSSLGTDLTRAVRRAEMIALASSTPHKEVYVFSDLQDSGWELSDEKSATAASQVAYFFVQVRPRQRIRNVGVTAVQLGAARPMAGVPFTIRPLLAVNDLDVQAITVRLNVDGENVGEQRVERLSGGRWAKPRFTHLFTRGGWHSGYVEVDDNHLPQDNRCYFAVEVLDKVSLLAVNGAPSDAPSRDELFFLKLALTVSPQEGARSPITVDTIGPAGLADADLSKYPLVILANVERLSDAALTKLEDYADGGGSVLCFLGDKVSAAFYNENLAGSNRRNGGLLPGKLAEREGDPAEDKEVATISAVDYEHPALSAFGDPHFASLGGRSVTFKALWRMEVPAANVLMKASTGSPLLVEKRFGRGRVLVFTSTCDRDWTNFPIRPAFLPFVHRLVVYLAQEPLGMQAFTHTGAVARIPVPALKGDTPLVKAPDGKSADAVLESGDTPALVVTNTTVPGIYTLLTPDQKGALGLFAVNLEDYESDLTYLDDALDGRGEGDSREARIESGLKDLLGRSQVVYVGEPEQTAEAVSAARGGFKLWDGLLLIVLGIALFEPWLANRISARHYVKPRAAPLVTGPEGVHAPRLVPQTEEVGS
jgi:hypothetical protein